ncbi:hypothetical protein [Winogradskyella luteola]|uniref:hypothetical protein n=1 Tax=Winogradskyella luteola TaxID=2828330 RepID=UPI003F74B66A
MKVIIQILVKCYLIKKVGGIIAAAAIDPIRWLFIFWIPEVYGMDVKSIGFYAWVPYVGAMVGAWFGGLLAQNCIKAGWSVNKIRKLVA